jgi:hypothetical protein
MRNEIYIEGKAHFSKNYKSTNIEPCLINPTYSLNTWLLYPKHLENVLCYENRHWEENLEELQDRFAPFIIPDGEEENSIDGIYSQKPNGRTIYIGKEIFDIEGRLMQLLQPVALICDANAEGWYALPYIKWEWAKMQIKENNHIDAEKYAEYHIGLTMGKANLYADFSDVQKMQDENGVIHYITT